MSKGSAARFGHTQVFPVRSFDGGLNAEIESFYVRDNQIVEAKNVEVRLGGSVRPRLGLRRYDSASSEHYDLDPGNLTLEPINGHRYVKADGFDEIIFYGTATNGSNESIFGDDGSGLFGFLSISAVAGDNGGVSFEQWKDILYMSSKNFGPKNYQKGATIQTGSTLYEARTPTNKAYIASDAVVGSPSAGQGLFTIEDGGTGNLASAKGYNYRFTFERYHGNEFTGESMPINTDLDLDDDLPNYIEVGLDGGAHSGSINLRKTSSLLSLSGLNFDVKYINIYRTPALSTAIPSANDEKIDFGFYFLDQISFETFWNATANELIYTDAGDVEIDGGKQVFYNRFTKPAVGEFLQVHKNRMWIANLASGGYGVSATFLTKFPYVITIPESPSRIFYSEYNQPEAFKATNFFDVSVHDGEPITGFTRFENKYLIAFKPNSMWGIFGGDIENALGIDIELSAIDDSIGCIAPRSISYGEGGLIWLSNQGVKFYDGSKPLSMASELIDPILDNIAPARKKYATGTYTQDRKYILSFSDSTQNSDENTVALEFDFRTKTWTRKLFGNSTVYGVNDYIEARKQEEAGEVYALLAHVDSAVGNIQVLDQVQYDIVPDDGVSWSFKTKHFDCGLPDVIKSFKTIIVHLKHSSTVTVNYNIDDGCRTGALSLVPLDCSGNAVHLWDEADLNWQGSPIEDSTFLWLGGSGSGGAGSQQDYVINVAEIDTPQADPIGVRIQFEFTGTATTQGQEIQGVSILYVPERRISNA